MELLTKQVRLSCTLDWLGLGGAGLGFTQSQGRGL
jgi:hypothetical protein